MAKNVSALDAYQEGQLPTARLHHRARRRCAATPSRGELGGGRVQRQGRNVQRAETNRLGRPQAEQKHGLNPPAFDASVNFALTEF